MEYIHYQTVWYAWVCQRAQKSIQLNLFRFFFIIIAFSIAAVESHTGHMAFMLWPGRAAAFTRPALAGGRRRDKTFCAGQKVETKDRRKMSQRLKNTPTVPELLRSKARQQSGLKRNPYLVVPHSRCDCGGKKSAGRRPSCDEAEFKSRRVFCRYETTLVSPWAAWC